MTNREKQNTLYCLRHFLGEVMCNGCELYGNTENCIMETLIPAIVSVQSEVTDEEHEEFIDNALNNMYKALEGDIDNE